MQASSQTQKPPAPSRLVNLFSPKSDSGGNAQEYVLLGLLLTGFSLCALLAVFGFSTQPESQLYRSISLVVLAASVALLILMKVQGINSLFKHVLLVLMLLWAISMVFLGNNAVILSCILALLITTYAMQCHETRLALQWSLVTYISLSSSIVIHAFIRGDGIDMFQLLSVYCFWSVSYALISLVMIFQKSQAEQMSLQLERLVKDTQYQATHDELTGLPNRMLFHDRLTRAVSRAKRQLSSFAVMYVDINGFQKAINTLGDQVGDDILQAISHRLLINVRLSDTVARMEDDEFAIILEQVDDEAKIGKIIDNLIGEISKPIDGLDQCFTATMGISIFPDDDTNADALLKQAHAASGIARESGETFKFYGDCE